MFFNMFDNYQITIVKNRHPIKILYILFLCKTLMGLDTFLTIAYKKKRLWAGFDGIISFIFSISQISRLVIIYNCSSKH